MSPQAPARPVRVFISRTSAGFAATAAERDAGLQRTAEKVAAVLESLGCKVDAQPTFTPHWAGVKHMLVDKLHDCDAVIALLGPAHGSLMEEPLPADPRLGLKDPRTHGGTWSYAQLEYLVARDLPRPIFPFLCEGPELIAPFTQDPDLARRQQHFIDTFVKDHTATWQSYTTWAGLEAALRALKIPHVSLPPNNLPFLTLGSLFVGRDEFLEKIRTQLVPGTATVITQPAAIHGMGGVGKTRTAVEFALAHRSAYTALLFITADSADTLHRDIAALCGPLVLNLPEQDAQETEVQYQAALRWLQRHPGWFLLVDNVDSEPAQKAVAELTRLIPAGHILITTRLAAWPTGFLPLDLDVLTPADSVRLLLTHTDGRRTTRPDDTATAEKIATHLDGLALALEQAAAWVRHRGSRTLADYLAAWEKENARLLSNYQDKGAGDYHKDYPHLPRPLLVTYQTSNAQLTPQAHQLFRLLSWLAPDPIPAEALAHLTDPPDVPGLLADLADLHILTRTADGTTVRVHRLLQQITQIEQETESPPPALLAALAWVDGEYLGDPADVRAWPVLLPLTPHAIAAAQAGAARHLPEPAARLLNDAAGLLKTRADHHHAEPLYRQSLALAEQHHGPEHPVVASCLNNLAELLRATNRQSESEPLMRRALGIDEASFGPDHPKVATRLNNLAQLLKATNRLADAEPLMRRALGIDEAAFGPDHPDVARDLNNLALLLKATNRLPEAEPLMRRALGIDEAAFGPDHPEVARDLNNLAQVLKATNRLPEAEPLMRRALGIWEASLGADHPRVAAGLNNLAALLQDTNRQSEAEPLMRRALGIDEASFGPDHPEVAIRLNNLARLLQNTNRLAEAEPLMRRMVGIFVQFTRATGHPHPHLQTAVGNYWRLLEAMGDGEAVVREKLDAVLAPVGGVDKFPLPSPQAKFPVAGCAVGLAVVGGLCWWLGFLRETAWVAGVWAVLAFVGWVRRKRAGK